MQRDTRAVCEGVMGGAIGTATMSAVTMAVRRAGGMGQHPPEAITVAVLDAADARPRSKETQDALAVVLHFAFGIGTGALFALLYRRVPALRRVNVVLAATSYATLVWAASYLGWIPALGILPPATRDEPGRARTMLFAHWVYGATLGAVVGKKPLFSENRMPTSR